MQEYRCCLSCGNYFEVNEENKDEQYCSKDCYKEYIMCSICGNYCEKIAREDSNSFVCSEECARQYAFNAATKKTTEIAVE
jgi:hypothetical protein